VEKEATPAINSLTTAISGLTSILAGLRPYAPDLVAGLFNAFGGSTGAYYDANGHYAQISSVLSGGPVGLTGVLGLLGGISGSLPVLGGGRTGLLARCPGGASAPATAGGNPWTTPDVLAATGTVCNPIDDQR
jgi:hypothetical protein